MSQSDDDDARDLAAAAAGDREAFGRVYDRHAAVVLSLCRRWHDSASRSPSEADDALQETFIRAFGMLDRLDATITGEGFRRWLYAIARKVCSERRRAARRRFHHEEIAMTQAAVTLNHVRADHRERDGHAAADLDDLDRLTRAIDQLEDDERLAIHLYYLDADPVRAAGPALNLSRSAYYKLLARARNKLSVLMKAENLAPIHISTSPAGSIPPGPFRLPATGE